MPANGKTILITGVTCGLPTRGDLMVVTQISVPARVSDAEK